MIYGTGSMYGYSAGRRAALALLICRQEFGGVVIGRVLARIHRKLGASQLGSSVSFVRFTRVAERPT